MNELDLQIGTVDLEINTVNSVDVSFQAQTMRGFIHVRFGSFNQM